MIDYIEKIPNNVDLGRDRVLQRWPDWLYS